MQKYSVYLETETEKYDLLRAIRATGCHLTDVSGCGSGYLVSLEADDERRAILERVWYSPEIDALTPGEAWAAWKAGRLTMGQLATWQERHGGYFSPAGEVPPC